MTFCDVLKSYIKRKMGDMGQNNIPCIEEKSQIFKKIDHFTKISETQLSTALIHFTIVVFLLHFDL